MFPCSSVKRLYLFPLPLCVALGGIGLVLFKGTKKEVSRGIKFYILFKTDKAEGMNMEISVGMLFEVSETEVRAMLEELGVLLVECRERQ